MVPGILIILIFLAIAALMITRKMPALLALPVMAVSIALVAGVSAGLPWMPPPVANPTSSPSPTPTALTVASPAPTATVATSPTPPPPPVPPPPPPPAPKSLFAFLFDTVLTQGSARLALPMMFAVFGAILSQVVMRQGIAQRIVRVAAEYAGDHKVLLALLLTGAMAVVFTSLTGLGAVIMIGSLALPIMTGAGLSGTYAACLMLLAISLGGVFNPANLGFFSEVLKVDFAQVKSFAMAYGLLLGLATLAFLLIEGRRESQRFVWALQDAGAAPPVPIYALITPIIPIALIGLPGLKIGIPLTDIEFFTVPGTPFPIIPAFLAGILYGCLTTEPTRTIPNLTAAFLEGLKDVAPVIGLFIGIGMMLNAMMDDSTKLIMKPFIEAILPRSAAGFVLFFTLLAPLTLYRGPLNTYGLGAGFALLIVGSGLIPAAAVMAAFLCVGQMQGVCDPTNTHNVWIAQFTKGSTETFMKKTVPYVWAFILLALIYAVAVRGVMG